MKAVKWRSIPDIIDIRPLLPGEMSGWFPAEVLQTQTCINNTTATWENLFQINSYLTWL